MSIEFKTTINEKWDAKQFEEHSERLIEIIKVTIIHYISNTFSEGKELDYILNLIINSCISSLINTILTITENDKKAQVEVVDFSEKLLDFLGYKVKNHFNRTIN